MLFMIFLVYCFALSKAYFYITSDYASTPYDFIFTFIGALSMFCFILVMAMATITAILLAFVHFYNFFESNFINFYSIFCFNVAVFFYTLVGFLLNLVLRVKVLAFTRPFLFSFLCSVTLASLVFVLMFSCLYSLEVYWEVREMSRLLITEVDIQCQREEAEAFFKRLRSSWWV